MATLLNGSTLRALRAIRHITQADLAASAGVSPNAIAEYETGTRDLRVGTLRKIFDALGVQVTYKMDGKELTGL